MEQFGSNQCSFDKERTIMPDPLEEYKKLLEADIDKSVAKARAAEQSNASKPTVKAELATELIGLTEVVDSIEVTDELTKAITLPPKRDDYKWQPDYGVPMFVLSSPLKKPPTAIASEVKKKIEDGNSRAIELSEVAGPYLNVRLSKEFLASRLNGILAKPQEVALAPKTGNVVVVDFSSPNVAKPFGVNHLRSTVIGEAIARILEANGDVVIRDNHLGDWGTQFGNLVAAQEVYAPETDFTELSTDELNKLYVRFSNEKKWNPELVLRGRDNFRKLSSKDPELMSKWFHSVQQSRSEFSEVYDRMGIQFDTQIGEAYFEESAESLIAGIVKMPKGELDALNIVSNEDGSVYINGEHPVILRTQDGYCVYAARDLATILFRAMNYSPNSVIYVVGEEQSTSFNAVFDTANKLGMADTKDGEVKLEHVAFGLLLDSNGTKLSTRRGTSGKLTDIIGELDSVAYKEIKSRNPDMAEEEVLSNARVLSMGAIIWNDLRTERRRNVRFDAERMLELGSGTVVDVLYSYVRTSRILEKINQPEESELSVEPNQLSEASDIERGLGVKLIEFNDVIRRAASEYMPHHLVQYLHELSQIHGRFYENFPVINETDADRKNLRIALHKAYQTTVKGGLSLLNIQVPTKL